MDDLSQLKKLRKKLDLTQKEFSQRAGVSQSLIAKIESGKIDPSYSNAKKIIETINSIDKENDLTAKDIMHRKIVNVKPSDTLKETIQLMRSKNISQMPVLKNEKVVGFISESVLLEKVLEGKSQSKVGDAMEPNPPILPPNTSKDVLANLLKHFPLVLIENKGELVGIVTKVDLLKAVYK